MTDLTFCYQHMTAYDLQALDTLDNADFMNGELSDEELEIPHHMIPPSPEDTDTLPTQVHPSYPFGNPTNLTHPAALPYARGEPGRGLYEDQGGMVVSRWRDLGLDILLPVNEEKEEAERAARARKLANGAAQGNHPGGTGTHNHAHDEDSGGSGEDDNEDEEDDEEDEEEEEDEDSNVTHASLGSTMETQSVALGF